MFSTQTKAHSLTSAKVESAQDMQMRLRALEAPRGLGISVSQGGHGRIKIDSLDAGGVASICGLRKGDEISSINRHSINNPRDFSKAMESRKDGDFYLKVQRGGQNIDIKILGYRDRAAFGVRARDSDVDAMIIKPAGGTPITRPAQSAAAIYTLGKTFADHIKLKDDDRIVRIRTDGKAIEIHGKKDLEDAISQIVPGKPLTILFGRFSEGTFMPKVIKTIAEKASKYMDHIAWSQARL